VIDGDRIKTGKCKEKSVSHQPVDLKRAHPMEHKEKQTETNHQRNNTIGETAVGWKALRHL